jgi:hypothetical protein
MLLPATALAASSVTATANPRVVAPGGSFTYTISASVTGNQAIRILGDPEFDATMRVVAISNSPSFLLRNGQAQRSLTRTYRLRASAAGTYTIKAPKVRMGNRVATPAPVEITVSATARPRRSSPRSSGPGNPRAANERVFISHRLQPTTKPYVGQQLTLSYSLYSDAFRLNVNPQPPDEPSLDDFWIEDLSQKIAGRRSTVRLGGKLMVKADLRAYALFPLAAGPIRIEPLTMDALIGGFLRGQKRVHLKSDPIEIDVRPLPPNSPDSFSEGNVGQFEFEATTDRITAKMGAPITIRLRVRGAGQLRRVTLPDLPEIEGARVAGSDMNTERRVRNGIVGGEKVAEYTLIAEREGTLTIPSLEFSYFDPEAETYETVRTAPIDIEVAGGEVVLSDQSPPISASSDKRKAEEVGVLEGMLQELGPPRDEISTAGADAPWASRTVFWILLLLPTLGIVGVWLERPLRRRLSARRPGRRRGNAYKEAISELRDAGSSPNELLDAIRNAVATYAVEVAQVPTGAVSAGELPAHLTRRGVSAGLADRLGKLLRDVNELRYSPAGSGALSPEQLREECERCLKQLEEDRRAGRWDCGALAALFVATACASILATGILAPGAAVAQQAPDERISQAVAAQKNNWTDAARLWSLVARSHPESPDVLLNLGIAHARSGDFGRARLALERAALYAPGDAEIERNQELVHRIVRLRQIEGARGAPTATRANTTSEGLFWWQLAAGTSPDLLPTLLVAMLWLLLLATLGRRFLAPGAARDASFVAAWIFGIGIAVCAACWVARAQILADTRPAVVLADDIKLREGPSQHAGLARAHTLIVPGVLLPIRAESDGWVKLGLANDAHAWTRRENIEFVLPQ